MADEAIKVMVIDDDEEDYLLIREVFGQVRSASYQVEWAPGYEEGRKALANGVHDAFLLDYQIGPDSGMDLLAEAVEKGCKKPVIMLTGHGGHEVDMEAMRAGAVDYLDKKDVNPATLERSVRYALAHFHTLEELRKARDQAEKATLLKDKFVSLVSHDLKGPLGGICGFLQLIRQKLAEAGDTESMGMVNLSIASCQKMLVMINELLTIGRFKTGKIRPLVSPVDVHLMVEEDFKVFAPFAEQKGVKTSNELPPGFTLMADPAMLGEVLHNILSNAVKFTSAGGKVTVFAPTGKADTVAIADTGTGILPGFRDRLFRYEEKTTTAGTAGETGTGFGLPLTFDIVRAHNGSLYFETEEGKGTTFFIYIPTTPSLGY